MYRIKFEKKYNNSGTVSTFFINNSLDETHNGKNTKENKEIVEKKENKEIRNIIWIEYGPSVQLSFSPHGPQPPSRDSPTPRSHRQKSTRTLSLLRPAATPVSLGDTLLTCAASTKRTPNGAPHHRMDRDGSRAAGGEGPPMAEAGSTPSSRPPPSPGIEALAAGDSVFLFWFLPLMITHFLILFTPNFFFCFCYERIRCPVHCVSPRFINHN
jgi:hypothetical protein